MTSVLESYSYIFSYWLFIWYLLFIFDITKYNPKLILQFALLHNIIVLIYQMLMNENICANGIFICGMIYLKVIPLYTIKDTKVNCYDLRVSVLVYLLFLGWLKIRNKELFEFQLNLMREFVHTPERNSPTTIVSGLMNK